MSLVFPSDGLLGRLHHACLGGDWLQNLGSTQGVVGTDALPVVVSMTSQIGSMFFLQIDRWPRAVIVGLREQGTQRA